MRMHHSNKSQHHGLQMKLHHYEMHTRNATQRQPHSGRMFRYCYLNPVVGGGVLRNVNVVGLVW